MEIGTGTESSAWCADGSGVDLIAGGGSVLLGAGEVAANPALFIESCAVMVAGVMPETSWPGLAVNDGFDRSAMRGAEEVELSSFGTRVVGGFGSAVAGGVEPTLASELCTAMPAARSAPAVWEMEIRSEEAEMVGGAEIAGSCVIVNCAEAGRRVVSVSFVEVDEPGIVAPWGGLSTCIPSPESGMSILLWTDNSESLGRFFCGRSGIEGALSRGPGRGASPSAVNLFASFVSKLISEARAEPLGTTSEDAVSLGTFPSGRTGPVKAPPVSGLMRGSEGSVSISLAGNGLVNAGSVKETCGGTSVEESCAET